jgi:hypothetical protein
LRRFRSIIDITTKGNQFVIPGQPVDAQGPFASIGLCGDPRTGNGVAPIRRLRGGRSEADRDGAAVVVVSVDVGRVQTMLWLVTTILIALDFVVSVAAGMRLLPYTITRFFDGDAKVNFPTGAKTTLLLAATLLMLGCWTAGRRDQHRVRQPRNRPDVKCPTRGRLHGKVLVGRASGLVSDYVEVLHGGIGGARQGARQGVRG